MRDVEAAAAKNNKRAELAIKLFYNDIVNILDNIIWKWKVLMVNLYCWYW